MSIVHVHGYAKGERQLDTSGIDGGDGKLYIASFVLLLSYPHRVGLTQLNVSTQQILLHVFEEKTILLCVEEWKLVS